MRLAASAVALTATLVSSEQSAPTAPQLAQAAVVQPISTRVDAPARTGLPIWVFADLQGPLTARYPYGEDPRYLGSNRLELKRDGKTLPPQPGYGRGGPPGLVVGSIAPPRAPQNRLPLHLAFAIDKPGRYSVRWSVVVERLETGPPLSRHDELLAQSNWLEFDVKTAKLSEREAWLRRLLAAAPADEGAYVGDYLPSLLAGAPDPRVARKVVEGTYSARAFIASYALVTTTECRCPSRSRRRKP